MNPDDHATEKRGHLRRNLVPYNYALESPLCENGMTAGSLGLLPGWGGGYSKRFRTGVCRPRPLNVDPVLEAFCIESDIPFWKKANFQSVRSSSGAPKSRPRWAAHSRVGIVRE